MIILQRLSRIKKKFYIISNDLNDEIRMSEIDENVIEKIKANKADFKNIFVEDNKIPLVRLWKSNNIVNYYEYNGHGKFQYIPSHSITSWEHFLVHNVKTYKDIKKWYSIIPPVNVSYNKHRDLYNFGNGNHRVNLCNLLDLPIPSYVH